MVNMAPKKVQSTQVLVQLPNPSFLTYVTEFRVLSLKKREEANSKEEKKELNLGYAMIS